MIRLEQERADVSHGNARHALCFPSNPTDTALVTMVSFPLFSLPLFSRQVCRDRLLLPFCSAFPCSPLMSVETASASAVPFFFLVLFVHVHVEFLF